MPLVELNPAFRKDDLARLLGGKQYDGFSHSVGTKVRLWKGRLNEIIRPKLIYRIQKIKSVVKGTIYLGGEYKFKSPKLARTVNGCKEIVCFLGTIGGGIEKEIFHLTHQKRLSEAYILDAMGSLAVENMVDQFHYRMGEKSKSRNKMVSLRFSPGYCDWHITQQKELFKVLDSRRIGVELTYTCLMKPRKSISGVFGIYSSSSTKDVMPYNPCLDCQKKDCKARRA